MTVGSGGDAFVWRKMVKRFRRWYQHDEKMQLARDECNRVIPTAANPLPDCDQFDKVNHRRFLGKIGAPTPRLLYVLKRPAELLDVVATLPKSWVIKPTGAAYNDGVSVIYNQLDVTRGYAALDVHRIVADLDALCAAGGRRGLLTPDDQGGSAQLEKTAGQQGVKVVWNVPM